jgi:bifunctional DNA-binding transcriptional regulator/antitoxin component of YhaV-PrlF toxin-antitoxin module
MAEYQIRLRDGGTLTLPQELRDQYQLSAGETLTLLDLGGVFVLSPKDAMVPKLASEIERLRIEAGISLDELIDAARQDRDGSSAAG